MVAMLVPIGHSMGPLYPAHGDPERDKHGIRHGDGIFSVDDEELRIWMLAHGEPRRVAQERPNRPMLYDTAGDWRISHINSVVDRLRDVGLLAEFHYGTSEARAFAHTHQVYPLSPGLGNSAETPWYFNIGLPGIPRVIVSSDAYHLWIFAHRHSSLWEAINYLSAERKRSPKEGEEQDADKILAHFLDALPAMLATASAYVDRVR